jgi:hypothetical protein
MRLYAQSARFDDHQRALGEDELRKLAPSIFAVEAHASRSDRFKAIPTWEVLKGVMNEGFMPVAATQAVARLDDRRDYTKHMIRLRKIDTEKKYSVGDTTLEIILKNANDGTSAYDLMAGLFRIQCLNSLVAQTSTIDTVKVRHTGDVTSKVIEGTFKVLNSADRLLSAPADWSNIRLDSDTKMAFAEAARVIRFGDANGEVNTPVQARQMLIPRRAGDQANDLWTTFNVVQENAIRGGLTGIRRDEHGNARRATTRQVTGIDQDVKLNKALWVLAERMAELKQAA